METSNIRYVEIGPENEALYFKGFAQVYQEAFSGPPYFEEYDEEMVDNLAWKPHRRLGCIILALDGERAVGLGCCLPLARISANCPNSLFLLSLRRRPGLPFHTMETCYMSELAVLDEYRNRGIGTELIKRRLDWAKSQGINYYLMRTAAEGSNSLSLYSRLGAKIVPGLEQDMSKDGVGTASQKRIFLFGPVS